MKLACCTVILGFAAVPAFSEPPDFEIGGIVVDSKTNEPIRGVRVTATGWDQVRNQGSEVLVCLTGEDGKFRFTGLPENTSFDIDTVKAGYFPGRNEGRHLTSSTSFTQGMIRQVALTVTVRDISGLPVAGAAVAIAAPWENKFSPRSLTGQDGTIRTAVFPEHVRVLILPPGSGTLFCAQDLTFAPLYYPGTSDRNRATAIDLTSGKDFHAELTVMPVPARQIHAHLAVPGRLNTVFVLPVGGGIDSVVWGMIQYEDGSRDVQISGLPPGDYVVHFDISAQTQLGYLKTVHVAEPGVTHIEVSAADRNLGR